MSISERRRKKVKQILIKSIGALAIAILALALGMILDGGGADMSIATSIIGGLSR